MIEYLTEWSIRCSVPNQIRVRVQSGLSQPEFDSRPEPDVLWVKARRYLDRHPNADDVFLLIEVSDSSLSTDRDDKTLLYAKAGIAEYWVVNSVEELIHVYRAPDQSGYRSMQTFACGESIAPLILPTALLNIADLFGHA